MEASQNEVATIFMIIGYQQEIYNIYLTEINNINSWTVKKRNIESYYVYKKWQLNNNM